MAYGPGALMASAAGLTDSWELARRTGGGRRPAGSMAQRAK